MMICSTLVDQQEQPMYYPLLDSPIRPGVRQLQLWLEVAWADGGLASPLQIRYYIDGLQATTLKELNSSNSSQVQING